MGVYDRERAKEHIAELACRGEGLVTFWRESTEVLRRTLPHYWTPCWFTLDPVSLLITSHFHEGLAEIPSDWLAQEYYDDDVNQLADVARSQRGVSTLHDATGGDPSGSRRWQRNMTVGGDQEMISALRTPAGDVWGALGVYREPGQPMFDRDDIEFVGALAPLFAEGARRALLIGEATDPEGPQSPGLVVLSADWDVESLTPGVDRWLSELCDGDWDGGRLPSSVQAVAGRALRAAETREGPNEIAIARVLSRSGTWVVLHGAALVANGSRRVAVIIEPAHPARISELLMSAYGLTDREQDVTRLVLQGDSTAQIAGRLVVSPHTVQQHLKSVFEKTGVRSRRELVGKVFFAHYEPRVRDNERRALSEQPVRGGPFPA
ncbi:MAG: LuxR C-terminal-related transcriptional regulator [Chloroflexota bacterium]|nr:LuxR C-terminal-related transcriptional regulator [Chloroflexota bacterium]